MVLASKAGMRRFAAILVVLLLSTFAQSLSAKTVIVAIGDSITYAGTNWGSGVHRNTVFGGWVTRLRDRLQDDFPDQYEVLNRGINGDTAQGVFNRLDRDVVSRQPGIVLVAIGTNDAYGYAGVNVPARNADDYQSVMRRIFDKLEQDLPGTPVFAMGMSTPLKKYATGLAFNQDFLDTQFAAYNDVLKELTREYGYFYVDIPSKWPGDVEESWELSADGIHPNDAGYDMMTDILYAFLTSTVSVESQYWLIATWGNLRSF
jgi:acyl-CoA thioesterase-1